MALGRMILPAKVDEAGRPARLYQPSLYPVVVILGKWPEKCR